MNSSLPEIRLSPSCPPENESDHLQKSCIVEDPVHEATAVLLRFLSCVFFSLDLVGK